MTPQLMLHDLRDLAIPGGIDGRARPAVSEAELAPCECPEFCLRDHQND